MPRGRPKKEAPNRSDGRYEVKITIGTDINGKSIQKSFYSYESKDDARMQGLEYLRKLKAGDEQDISRKKNFGVWTNEWLKTYILGKVKDSTYNNNFDIPTRLHIIPYFGKRNLSDIRPADIQKFLDMKAESYSASTVRKMRNCLLDIFDTAIENKLCTSNPVTRHIKASSTKPKTQKRFYTAEQRSKIIEYAKTHRFGLPIIVMLLTGISRSELLGLQWDDITPDYVMHIRRGVTDVKNASTGKWEVIVDDGLKNEFRRRDIPISEELYGLIQNKPRVLSLGGSIRNKTPLRKVRPAHIFHSTTGEVQSPHNFSYYVFKPFMSDMVEHFKSQEIDMPALTPHELRHTAATQWALDKVDLYTIAKLGGWTDLKMLAKVYGHADVEAMRAALGLEGSDGEDAGKG